MVTIRVKTGTRDRLDGTVTQLKKHRSGRVSHDDAIQSLYKDNTEQRALIRGLQEKLTLAQTTEKEVVALGEESPDDLIEHPIREPSEHAKCPHFNPSADEGFVVCQKDHFKRGVIHKIPESVCIKCWQQHKDVLVPKLESNIQPCLCRYEHAGDFFCVKKPPRAVKLIHALKTCSVCPDRLTKEKAQSLGLILETRKYVICGAKEQEDEKVGTMLFCPRATQWTNIKQCEEIECSQFKTIQANIGASTYVKG